MDDRREELRRVLGKDHPSVTRVVEPVPVEPPKASSLLKGPVIGKGIFRTRLNWGVIVLGIGLVLFLVFQSVVRPRVGG